MRKNVKNAMMIILKIKIIFVLNFLKKAFWIVLNTMVFKYALNVLVDITSNPTPPVFLSNQFKTVYNMMERQMSQNALNAVQDFFLQDLHAQNVQIPKVY